LQHWICASLSLRGVGGRDGVNDRLCFLMSNLLIILDHVPQMISSRIMCFAHTHRVMREVDIAVITKEFGHFETPA